MLSLIVFCYAKDYSGTKHLLYSDNSNAIETSDTYDILQLSETLNHFVTSGSLLNSNIYKTAALTLLRNCSIQTLLMRSRNNMSICCEIKDTNI